MASKQEVEKFLKEFKVKMHLIGISFRDDRSKNAQTLHDLGITPAQRIDVLKSLKIENYSEGPLDEKLHGILSMWVFGKEVKQQEIYIKISMGQENSEVICISFHFPEHSINYPFKN